MKIVKVYLEEFDNLQIEFFADLHIGSKKCNWAQIHERIEKVRNNPNVYCIIAGDLINNSTKTSVGDVFTEELSPMDSMKTAVDLFTPIRDKILTITSGNHERRSYKNDGQDIMYWFAVSLGKADVYDYTSTLLFLRFGKSNRDVNRKQCYTIYTTHGDGANGRMVGGKANSLARRAEIVNADIVVCGHTHQPITFKQTSFELDYANSNVKTKETTCINLASTLDYEGYAELYGMRPSSTANPVLLLGGRKKDIKVLL